MEVFAILRLFILSSFFLFQYVIATEPTNATSIKDAPACAIEQFSQLVDQPTFSDANIKRLCHDGSLANAACSTILMQCSMRDLFDFLKLEQIACGRPELDNDHKIRGVNYAILGIVVVSVTLRILVKCTGFSQWGPDDFTVIAAAVLTVLQCIFMGLMTFEGLGRNIWIFNDETITKFYIYLLVVQYAYVLSLCLVELSILFFFLRTFPDQSFRTLVKLTIGFDILTTIIFSICGAFQRQPFYLLWEGWKEFPPQGKTLNILAIILSHAGVNLVLDIWMFVLPLTQLYHLGLKPKKKAGVMLIFGVGIFLIAASCIRIPYLLSFSKSLNATCEFPNQVLPQQGVSLTRE
ncbi:hypothetical protein F53441_12991 [Fusarium austroafricanum]|uniref:Rhodopsin domain-containing protein n=1 Tax=Fusarium austroafricanum TaxID=2364996 RepID=A0A8H4NMR5_9HYPO|nr:hypothetical protein F53441_12991 [Fusarium austroafricanum]